MTTIIGIAGSLRAASLNKALLRAARDLMPIESTLEIATIERIPLYNGDVEATEGIPQAVSELKDKIAAADGLLLATPEYNHGIPGVFKNAIDWLSRPPADVSRVFRDRPTALVGASPGGFGTIMAQNDWLPVLRALGAQPWFGKRLLVSRAGSVFSDSGELLDDRVKEQLQQFLSGFVEFTQSK